MLLFPSTALLYHCCGLKFQIRLVPVALRYNIAFPATFEVCRVVIDGTTTTTTELFFMVIFFLQQWDDNI